MTVTPCRRLCVVYNPQYNNIPLQLLALYNPELVHFNKLYNNLPSRGLRLSPEAHDTDPGPTLDRMSHDLV